MNSKFIETVKISISTEQLFYSECIYNVAIEIHLKHEILKTVSFVSVAASACFLCQQHVAYLYSVESVMLGPAVLYIKL